MQNWESTAQCSVHLQFDWSYLKVSYNGGGWFISWKILIYGWWLGIPLWLVGNLPISWFVPKGILVCNDLWGAICLGIPRFLFRTFPFPTVLLFFFSASFRFSFFFAFSAFLHLCFGFCFLFFGFLLLSFCFSASLLFCCFCFLATLLVWFFCFLCSFSFPLASLFFCFLTGTATTTTTTTTRTTGTARRRITRTTGTTKTTRATKFTITTATAKRTKTRTKLSLHSLGECAAPSPYAPIQLFLFCCFVCSFFLFLCFGVNTIRPKKVE